MKRACVLLIAGLLAADLFAVRHAVFESDFYNRVFPVEHAANTAFSPLSAEIDVVVAAEALETIPRANVAEAMGVLVEFAGVYRPILERLAETTNGFSCTMARGFCLPDLSKARPDFLTRIRQDFGAEVLPLFPTEGAQCWFRTAMDGQMEDFVLEPSLAVSGRYALFDLMAIRAEWAEPFPTSGVRRLSFETPGKKTVKLDFLTDVRLAETWEDREYDILKLPLRGGWSFVAMLPKPGVELARVREDFSAMEIESLLAKFHARSPEAGRYRREPTVLVVPRFELDVTADFTAAVQAFRVPTSALARLCNGTAANRFVQRVRFSLREFGPFEKPLAEKPPERQLKVESARRRLLLNRPFLYFVLDDAFGTIPVAGQFTGTAEAVLPSADEKRKEKSKK